MAFYSFRHPGPEHFPSLQPIYTLALAGALANVLHHISLSMGDVRKASFNCMHPGHRACLFSWCLPWETGRGTTRCVSHPAMAHGPMQSITGSPAHPVASRGGHVPVVSGGHLQSRGPAAMGAAHPHNQGRPLAPRLCHGGLKLQQSKFKLDLRKTFFTVRARWPGNRCPGKGRGLHCWRGSRRATGLG